MKTYVYAGKMYDRCGEMLAAVMLDHEDSFLEDWQEWFESWLDGLNSCELYDWFMADYIGEHEDELMARFKDAIEVME